jgi:hypothetical protein
VIKSDLDNNYVAVVLAASDLARYGKEPSWGLVSPDPGLPGLPVDCGDDRNSAERAGDRWAVDAPARGSRRECNSDLDVGY